MIIVDRKTFIEMPPGIVFARFMPQPSDGSYYDLAFEEIFIKGKTISGGTFFSQRLHPWFEGCKSIKQYNETLVNMLLYGEQSPPVDYAYEYRDELFDDDQYFAIWAKEDVERLILRLQRALSDGYSEAVPAS